MPGASVGTNWVKGAPFAQFVPTDARSDICSHSITMEAFTPTQYKTDPNSIQAKENSLLD